MTQKNTGGPAFPGKVNVPDMEDVNTGEALTFREDDHPGMTLRDYFAAQLLSNLSISADSLDDPETRNNAASAIYSMADAMIEARNK